MCVGGGHVLCFVFVFLHFLAFFKDYIDFIQLLISVMNFFHFLLRTSIILINLLLKSFSCFLAVLEYSALSPVG